MPVPGRSSEILGRPRPTVRCAPLGPTVTEAPVLLRLIFRPGSHPPGVNRKARRSEQGTLDSAGAFSEVIGKGIQGIAVCCLRPIGFTKRFQAIRNLLRVSNLISKLATFSRSTEPLL